MKKTFKVGLGGVALVAIFALAITHFSSCGSRVLSPERIVIPVPVWINDTSSGGSGTGAHPAVITNRIRVSAGSLLVVECANKDCADLMGTSNSGGAPGNSKILFEWRIPNDLPANTEMSLSFRPAPGTKEQSSR